MESRHFDQASALPALTITPVRSIAFGHFSRLCVCALFFGDSEGTPWRQFAGCSGLGQNRRPTYQKRRQLGWEIAMEIKEILVLHHSHFDFGFTHTPPVLWELQREFIDSALDLLDVTEAWGLIDQPRWTVEVTIQVLKWLETASEDDIQRFKAYAKRQRMGLCAMLCHTTPLCNAEQLFRQLLPVKQLREQFGVKLNTLVQHDVNGTPWPMVDIMLDAGIDLFVMAVNLHFGGAVAERPSIFRWRGPSGRTIKVMNGEHYTMFDQHLNTHENNLDVMQAGLASYLTILNGKDYPYDFIYLTTAHAPVCYDNSPPNLDVAKLIRQWNAEGRGPVIRYVTPELLLDRINEIPDDELPVHNGDWTDFWNFGCSSNAMITKVNQSAKPRLYTRDLLASFNPRSHTAVQLAAEKAWWNLCLYDEHTWGFFLAMDPDNPFSRASAHFKDALAFDAREMTEYVLVNELEALAQNPETSFHQDGLLLVNSASSPQSAYIPLPEADANSGHKKVRTARFGPQARYILPELLSEQAQGFARVDLEPFSWKKLPFSALEPTGLPPVTHGPVEETVDTRPGFEKQFRKLLRGVSVQPHFIESPYHRLEYDQPTGRITGLWDKQRDWQVLDESSPWTFFELISEAPDPLVDPTRRALYARDLDKEKAGVTCWQTDWKARRQGAAQALGCYVKTHPRGVTLVLKFEVFGLNDLEQHITLLADSPMIHLRTRFTKEDIRTPESLYFVFPLNLPADWRSHFDTAGIPLELDAEQLPGASRDWVTVESFAAVHSPERGATLYCLDAPMVQIGDFNFGRYHASVEKRANPMLLAWPLNNYWDTNFRPSQPGLVDLSYGFGTHGPFDALQATQEGRRYATPVEIHPAINCEVEQGARFFEIESEGVQVLHVKPAADQQGVILRLVNVSHTPSTVKLDVPGRVLASASWVNSLEEETTPMAILDNAAEFRLASRRISGVRLRFY